MAGVAGSWQGGGEEGETDVITDRARTDICALTASRNKWRLPSAMVRPLTGSLSRASRVTRSQPEET